VNPIRSTLTSRIFLYLGALLVVGAIAGNAVVFRLQADLLERHAMETGTRLAQVLADSARFGLAAGDREGLEHLAEAALSREGVLSICFLDARGNTFLAKGLSREDEPWCSERFPGGLPGGDGAGGAASVTRTPQDGMVAVAPVHARGSFSSEETLYFDQAAAARTTIGHVALRVSEEPLRRTRRATLVRTAAMAAGLLAIGLAVTFLVVREATRPIRALAQLADRGTRSAATSLDKPSPTDAFGEAVNSLSQRFSDLEAVRRGLETTVAQRTRELAEAYRLLERERDQLDQKVQERTADLERTYHQLLHAGKLAEAGRVAAAAAHEFNNPLFGIRNVLVGLQNDTRLDPDQRDLASLAVHECDRLARLVREMQGMHRPTSGSRSPVDLNRVARELLLWCRKDFERRNVRVECHFADDLAPPVAVEDQVRQAVLNLLANAADALPPGGGTIRVSTERRGEEIALRVQDDGRGIMPEDRERIFAPFFTTKAEAKGTGLGLFVTREIVERHGGRIEVESAPGSGSTFTIVLPAGGDGS
jgi:signal transduction histidine kinase